MDAQQALADLTEISSQIQSAVLFDEGGSIIGSTFADEGRADALARSAGELMSVAEGISPSEARLTQLEVATTEGSVFVVRDEKLRIAATTGSNPTVGLVFYDLKSTLRNLEAGPDKGSAGGGRMTAASSPGGAPAGDRKKKTAAGKKKTAAKKTGAAKKKTAAEKPRPKKDGNDAS
jgi:predicted regulator of Ras-like GTPase activity (Roadblock/LC7/MglB family)